LLEGMNVQDDTLCVVGRRCFTRYCPDTCTLCGGSTDKDVLARARLGEPAGRARLVRVRDALGSGKGIEVVSGSGSITRAVVYRGCPFVVVTTSVRNETSGPMTVGELSALAAELEMGSPRRALRVLGCDGPHRASGQRASYAFMAVAERSTRAGMVCGWLTHERASGIVRLDARAARPRLEAVSEYGRLVVEPGESVVGESFALGWFDDALDGLEAYADAVAKANGIRLPRRVPSGYCTWYHARASEEKRTAELARFCARELRDYGLDFVQVDHGWQTSDRDYTSHNPQGPYSRGMGATAAAIARHGLRAGLWLIPFGWDPQAPALAAHPKWFVRRKDGSVYAVYWAGSCLDMTHPGARRFLRGVVTRMTKEWGYRYLKIDGLWSGMATKILYPSPRYRRDGLGGAVLHDRGKTQVEAYRDGLRLVRQAAGKGTFILGCTIAQNMRTMGASLGLVDGMRIGPDVGASWAGVLRCARPAAHLYFWHGRTWFNDPDCLMLREPLTLDQARAWGSLIALSGQMNVVSEWLPGLPAERLDVLKRTLPNAGLRGRPLDLLERPMPRVWHARVGEGEAEQHLVGLFNWDARRHARVRLELARLGLSPGEQVVGFDFWEDGFVAPFAGSLAVRLRPSSCRVLSLRVVRERPQVVSTSRHVAQGVVDLERVRWDGRRRVLRGVSRVVGGEGTELRLYADGWVVSSVRAAEGVMAEHEQEGACVRVRLSSASTRTVGWQVAFTEG